jgi:hypothetical protein
LSANPFCRHVSGVERERHCEGASLSDLAGDANGATVKLDQFLDQGEADPAALDRASACALNPAEPLKQMRQLFGRDARAGIANGDLGVAAVRRRLGRYGDLTFECELKGIRYEIENNFLPHVGVDVDLLRQRRAINN